MTFFSNGGWKVEFFAKLSHFVLSSVRPGAIGNFELKYSHSLLSDSPLFMFLWKGILEQRLGMLSFLFILFLPWTVFLQRARVLHIRILYWLCFCDYFNYWRQFLFFHFLLESVLDFHFEVASTKSYHQILILTCLLTIKWCLLGSVWQRHLLR